METPRDKEKIDFFPEETGLMSLGDLQKFIADELEQVGGETIRGRAFRPLTDGLGIGIPPKKPAPTATSRPTPRQARVAMPEVAKFFEPAPEIVPAVPEPPPPEPKAVAPRRVVLEHKPLPDPLQRPVVKWDPAPVLAPPEPVVQPPPVPQASFLRRLLAGVADQLFILGLLSLVLLITSVVLSREGGVLSKGLLTNLHHPAYARFAVLGFATIWMSYLALGVGVLDMTFGMWVWGLRINYQVASGESRFVRKIMRVVCSFFLEALLLPSPLLAIRVKGRNLVDMLSGSYLYRTA